VTATWREALGDCRLLVSGFGRWGGGVYDLTGSWPEAVDNLSTSGMTVGGGRLWRVLRAPGEQTSTCELLSYDDRGVRSYQRLDAVRDPHDLCWHDGTLYLTSSWDDAVWRIGDHPGDDPVLVWRAGTVPDGWHVNSLAVVDDQLHACAFGRFDRHKGWKGPAGRDTGLVVALGTGREILSGLTQPHTPRHAGARWYVCESGRGALTELDPTGTVVRRAPVKRFTRGLALVGRWALVGGSAFRGQGDDRAEVAVVDLDTFDVVDRIGLPCQDIYDVVAVPRALARGLAVGFGANAVRAVEQYRAARRPPDRWSAPPEAAVRLATPRVAGALARMGRPLPPEDLTGCAVRGQLPERLRAGSTLVVTLQVANHSPYALGSVPPRPVRVAARWFVAAGLEPMPNPAVPLPRVVHPGEGTAVEVPLEVPDAPGCYELRVALRQRGLGWFGVRAEGSVEVT
jgi:Domain of unknown function (DUF4915)